MILKILKKIKKILKSIRENIKRFKAKICDEKVYKLYSVSQWAQLEKLTILPAGKVEQIPYIDPPIMNRDSYHGASSSPKIATSNIPYVAELRNAKIYSKSSIVIVNNIALNDAATHPLYGANVNLKFEKAVIAQHKNQVVMRHDMYPIAEHEGGIFLGGLGSEAFGHWVQEFLPKIQFLEYHPDFKALPIIVDEQMPQSHFDYLSYVVKNRIIRLPVNTSLRCRRLLLAPTASFLPFEVIKNHRIPLHELGPLSPRSMYFLRERVIHHVQGKSSYGPKLYLSRRNMTWRKLTNDAEIAEFLAGKGFDIIDVETLSFEEQVRMFREAKYIVAPNGSALLNIIFSEPDVRLIVLSQPDLFNWGGYYGPMQSLGYDMLFVTGDDTQDKKHADYSIPIDRLREALSLYV